MNLGSDLASLSSDLHNGASVTAAIAGFAVRVGFDFGGTAAGASLGAVIGGGVLDVGTVPVGALLGGAVAGATKDDAAHGVETFIDNQCNKS